MSNPLVSIIVPVYKSEPFIRKCLDSLVNQTYKNLEIIIVDDGGPDLCGLICDEYSAKDERITVMHQENKGVAESRNLGLRIATGDYLFFVDSDDWVELNAISLAMGFIQEQRADILCFGFDEVYLSGEIITRVIDRPRELGKKQVIEELIAETGVVRNCLWNKLFARELFNDIVFPSTKSGSDSAISCLLFHRAGKIYAIDSVLYHYRIRTDSIMSERFLIKGVSNVILAWTGRLDFLEQEYPSLVDFQLSKIIREMIVGLVILKKDPAYPRFREDAVLFISKNKARMKYIANYSRIVWLYYYCRPLTFLYIWIRYVLLFPLK